MSYLRYAFIDEAGNTSLATEVPGTSTHYSVAAIVVDADRVDRLRSKVEAVRQKHFGPGEMKSSARGMKYGRRERILYDLSELDFGAVALVVDKRQVHEASPLQYKKSFLKFISGQLYRRLYGSNTALAVVADEHGSPEFMEGFARYVQARHMPDLFSSSSSFRFEKSHLEPLLQLADFIAGTVLKVISDPSDESRRLLGLIRSQLLAVIDWPPVLPYHPDPLLHQDGSAFDQTVREQAVIQAMRFLDENPDPADPVVADQLNCVQYLLFRYRYVDPTEYVSAKQIINLLGRSGRPYPITPRFFRTNIVAKLRDQGVLIVSGPRGLKLPNGANDLDAYVEQSRGMVEPMIARLRRYREIMMIASNAGLDILDSPKYMMLKNLCEHPLVQTDPNAGGECAPSSIPVSQPSSLLFGTINSEAR